MGPSTNTPSSRQRAARTAVVLGKARPANGDQSPGAGSNGKGRTSKVETFRQLSLPKAEVQAAQSSWREFLGLFPVPEDAAEAVWEALFDNVPIIQSLFTTPKALHSMRFVGSIDRLVQLLDDPPALWGFAEMLGFLHLHVLVNLSWALTFRESVIELMDSKLGSRFSAEASKGISDLLDYAGESIVFARKHSDVRLRIIQESWTIARDKEAADKGQHAQAAQLEKHAEMEAPSKNGRGRGKAAKDSPTNGKEGHQSPSALQQSKSSESAGSGEGSGHHSGEVIEKAATRVPTTFFDMFQVNAGVMGFQKSAGTWMAEVLESFDPIVSNLENSARVQEESEVLALRIVQRMKDSTVNLGEFRAVMLASLRSSLPKLWSSSHEEAWTWAWDNVARIIQLSLDKPIAQEKCLGQWLPSLTDEEKYDLRRAMHNGFFERAPAGQDYFKQSNTRLHFITDQVLDMTLRLYGSPKKMVSEISSLGLRHAGFGIPTDLFAPFVTSAVEVLRSRTDDEMVVEAFRWSLGLISKILVRTIREGSTVVMKAINSNSSPQLRTAMERAPRGERASWLLHVQVGDRHISPLAWAIQSGSLAVADHILKDLLTIRADRKRYYYGAEELFARHSDIVKLLCEDAPSLLITLLDGLVWRSVRPKHGVRRVNAYLKYVLINNEGKFSDSLQWVSSSGNPAIVSHTVIAALVETLWNGLVLRQFIYSRTWNIACLAVFILCQEILPQVAADSSDPWAVEVVIFLCRIFVYMAGMCRLAMFHLWRIWLWSRNTMRRIIEEIDTDGNGTIDHEEMIEALRRFRSTVKEEIQKALRVLRDEGPGGTEEARKNIANKEKNMYNLISTVLVVLQLFMFCHEPMLWCANTANWPTSECPATTGGLKYRYSIFTMCAMVVHWLILIDLAVFSTEISAFLLVCGHVLGEVKQFLTALAFLLLVFGSSISIFCRRCPDGGGDFSNMTNAIVSLFAITVGLYQGDYRDIQEEPLLLAAIFLFLLLSVVLLLNLLIAQLNRSYEYIYKDMLGFARLNRASLIVEAMNSCPKARWAKFVAGLKFEERIEFDEGDLGLPGGIQIQEPANLHRQTADSIRRYGGTADERQPWPEDRAVDASEDENGDDRLDRIEALLQKAMVQLTTLCKQNTSQPKNPAKVDSSRSSLIIEEDVDEDVSSPS